MGSFCLFHIVFSNQKVSKLCNTIGICSNGSHQFICFEVVFADTISRFDIFCSINVKDNFGKASGDILKQMLHSAFCVIQKRYFIQEFTLFVDDQKPGRHFILHFNLLDIAVILNCKCDIRCFQVAIRCKFFPECVSLTCHQTFDHMRGILNRSPFIHNIPVLIQHFQACTIQFCSSGNVRFSDLHCGRLVFLYRFQNNCFHILSLIGSIKVQDLIGGNESCRSFQLFYIVASKWKIQCTARLSLLIRSHFLKQGICLNDYFAVCGNIFFVVDTKYGTCHNSTIFRILFFNRNRYLLSFITDGHFLLYYRSILAFIDKDNFCSLRI